MVRKLVILIVFAVFTLPIWAKDTVVIPVSCVIPERVQLSQAQEEPRDYLVYYQEEIRGGDKVLVKTVVSK